MFYSWKMGDQSIEVSEENRDAAQALKANATYVISEGMQKNLALA